MTADERVTVKLQLQNAARFVADAKAAGHEIEVLGKKADRASKDAKPFSSELDRINRVTKAMRWPVAIAGVGIFGQALAAGAAGGGALLAALVPLVGLIATLPALGLAAGQGVGVAALAFAGLKDAVGGLNGQIDAKKFAQLSAPAQDFVLALDGMKTPLRDLQRSVQGAMLPGLTSGLRSALPALGALQGPLVQTGRVFGLIGERLGRLVGSRGFMKDLGDQARFNNVQFGRLGGAGLHIVNLMRNLAVTARPLVSWMVRLVSGWAASADAAVSLGRSGGGLGRMFEAVRVTMSRVGRIASDLGVAFFNIGRIGKREIGDSLLVSLVRGADALRKWTASGPGMSRIIGFFADAKPVIQATARLFGAIATEVLRFGAGSGGGLVGMLGTFTSMVKILGAMSRLVGPDTVVYAFLAGKVLATGLGALSAFTTGMQTLGITMAMVTGPVGLTVLGIGALGVAFALAYTKVGWFHDGVNRVFGFIRDHWPLILSILTGPIGAATIYIVRHFDSIVGTVTGMPGRIAAAASGMFDGIKNAFRSAINWIISAWNGLSFHIGGTNLGPFGHLPGATLGTPNIPMLASGGVVSGRGSWITGEAGPELNTSDGAGTVRVRPLGAGPASARVTRSAGLDPAGSTAPAQINVTVNPQPVYFDKYKVADLTADVVVEHAGRA
jgi:hypothetical protein